MIRIEAIKQTIKFMLTHSWINMSALILLIIAVYVFQHQIAIPQKVSLMMITTVMVFLGVFLGGAFLKLKQNYLWKINAGYRAVLITSYLVLVLSFNLLMFLLIIPELRGLQTLMPICATIFASQFVIANNFLSKLMFPIIPFIIMKIMSEIFSDSYKAQHYSYYLIIAATILLVFFMFNQNKSKNKSTKKEETDISNANNIAFMTTGFSAKQLSYINSKLGKLVIKWVDNSKGVLDWAILMPHTKLTIIALFYVSALFVSSFILKAEIIPAMPLLSIFFLPMLVIAMVIEARHLLKQTKSFAHVFAGKNFKQFKAKTLFAIDKNMIISSIIYSIGIFLSFTFLNITVDMIQLFSMFSLIVLVSLSVYPLMLCLNWVNMSLPLIAVVFAYSAILFKSLLWLKANPIMTIDIMIIVVFFIVLIVIRILTQQIFLKKPIEVLMK